MVMVGQFSELHFVNDSHPVHNIQVLKKTNDKMKTIKKVRFKLKCSKEDLLVENEQRLSSDDDIADADFETIDLTFSDDVCDNPLSHENNNELKGVKKKKKFRKRVGASLKWF